MSILTVVRVSIEGLTPAVGIMAPQELTACLARVTRYYQFDTSTEVMTEYGSPTVEYLYGATTASLTAELQQQQQQLLDQIAALDDEILALEAL